MKAIIYGRYGPPEVLHPAEVACARPPRCRHPRACHPSVEGGHSLNTALCRLTGGAALASVIIWMAIFPLYTMGNPAVSLYNGASIAEDLFRLRHIVFTRILLGLGLYITLMVFAAGVRELVRRASPGNEWLGTLSFGAMVVWVGVTLVANGLSAHPQQLHRVRDDRVLHGHGCRCDVGDRNPATVDGPTRVGERVPLRARDSDDVCRSNRSCGLLQRRRLDLLAYAVVSLGVRCLFCLTGDTMRHG